MEEAVKHYAHICMEERRQIYRLLSGQKISITEIAARLGRHRSTIFREIQRNTHRHEEESVRGYFPVTAQDFVSERRRKQRKLIHSKQLRSYIIEKLQAYWSPDQISGYLRRREFGFYVCPETIYQYIYGAEGREQGLYRYLFKGKSKRRPRFGRKPRGKHIPVENRIHQRPAPVNERKVFGHWECDLMIFQKDLGNANVTSLIERKSRYMFVTKNENRISNGVMAGINSRVGKLPEPCRRSITFDRGSEFMSYPLLRRNLGMHSYFCDPSAPWQKGAVENNNGRIRRFLPANTNVAELSESDLWAICNRMNQTPRKCLG